MFFSSLMLQASSTKAGTVTLSLQQLQMLQQQQQAAAASSSQSSVVTTPNASRSATPTSVRKNLAKTASLGSNSSGSSSPALQQTPANPIVPDNILSAALMTSGIVEDDDDNSSRGSATPPPGTKPKKKKKKKESASVPVTQSLSITITTASSTLVTNTVSQSGKSSAADVYTFSSPTSVPSPTSTTPTRGRPSNVRTIPPEMLSESDKQDLLYIQQEVQRIKLKVHHALCLFLCFNCILLCIYILIQ